MEAPTLIELVSSVGEVLIALGALVFALLLARHEQVSRERQEKRIDELIETVRKKT